MAKFDVYFEEIKIHARDLVEKIRELLRESNIRRIIIRDDRGNTYMEIPLSVAAVGVIAMPILAAVGAMAALVANFSLVVERARETGEKPAPPAAEAEETPPAPS
jgi:repressor of nif and glnA expression